MNKIILKLLVLLHLKTSNSHTNIIILHKKPEKYFPEPRKYFSGFYTKLIQNRGILYATIKLFRSSRPI